MRVYESLWEFFFSLAFSKRDEEIHHPDLERDACSLFLLGPRSEEEWIFEYHCGEVPSQDAKRPSGQLCCPLIVPSELDRFNSLQEEEETMVGGGGKEPAGCEPSFPPLMLDAHHLYHKSCADSLNRWTIDHDSPK